MPLRRDKPQGPLMPPGSPPGGGQSIRGFNPASLNNMILILHTKNPLQHLQQGTF